jgi:tetratricopeptide (TPR) repeat protein
VAPRIIDPDAERLEVEVYEAHATYEDDTHTEWDTTRIAPTLTDTTDIPVLPRPTPPEPTLPEEAIFDLVGDALAARDRGDIHAAERQLTAALDWQPNHIEARIARGQCLRDMGDIPAAMSDFIKCQRQAPHSPSPHIEIGNLFFAKKDYVRAISHYSDALSIQPEHTLALCRRGISHHYRRQPARAIDDLTVARRIDGNIPNIDRYIKMVSITEKRRS